MENLELNEHEKKELEKRGFFVKENFNLENFLFDTFILFESIGAYIFIVFTIWSLILFHQFPEYTDTKSWILILLPIVFIYIQYLFHYIFLGKSFFVKESILIYGRIFHKESLIKERIFLKILRDYVDNVFTKDKNYFIMAVIILLGFLVIFEFIGVLLIGIFTGNFPIELLYFFGLVVFTFLLRELVEYFHPLYAFGNLGEKIQKLTPQIEKQSKQIQSEFQSNMNFSVLSNGFDSLSATFSETVSFVIKLEKVEARANKGNIFDSEKYINSLRSDIIEPLQSLREFLEVQKNKLLESQNELTRVRAGGSESTGNTELSSKRSESLIIELTENIEKLDVMIGKMG